MKDRQTFKRGAADTAPVGLAGHAGRTLPGAVALLLISTAFNYPAWAITGGEPDNGRHPNVCAAIAYHPVYGRLPFSGTLIHPRVILTAGHCVAMVESGETTLYGVSFDQEADVFDPRTWLHVSKVVGSYSGFAAAPGRIDIGTLILEKPVKGVTPAARPCGDLLNGLKKPGLLQAGPDGTRFTVVGYGCGLHWPPPDFIYPVSEEGKVARNVAQSGYLGLNDGWLFLNQNVAAGYGGTALGDSGGPTFWTDPITGNEVLVSVTSWGDVNSVATGITCRIDTVEALQFIQDVIDSLEK